MGFLKLREDRQATIEEHRALRDEIARLRAIVDTPPRIHDPMGVYGATHDEIVAALAMNKHMHNVIGKHGLEMDRLQHRVAERDRAALITAAQFDAEVRRAEDAHGEAQRWALEVERLRTHLKEADKLLEVAYRAHQKMGLEGEGARGHSHEVRMFALHFSQPETPKTPEHVILSGNGRYRRFRQRDREQVVGKEE